MQLAVEDAVGHDQLGEEVQDLVDPGIHETLDPLLVEESAADRRIALHLQPLVRLPVQLAGQGQFAQIEVRTEEPE